MNKKIYYTPFFGAVKLLEIDVLVDSPNVTGSYADESWTSTDKIYYHGV